MAKKNLLIITLLVAMLSTQVSHVYAEDVYLQIGYIDPSEGTIGEQKSPILIPQLSIIGNTITFNTSCDGCTLRLLDEDGEIEYSIVIPSSTTNLVLPSYLSGEYEIQIIRGNFCFYGYITL